jgi:hypothetical protein
MPYNVLIQRTPVEISHDSNPLELVWLGMKSKNSFVIMIPNLFTLVSLGTMSFMWICQRNDSINFISFLPNEMKWWVPNKILLHFSYGHYFICRIEPCRIFSIKSFHTTFRSKYGIHSNLFDIIFCFSCAKQTSMHIKSCRTWMNMTLQSYFPCFVFWESYESKSPQTFIFLDVWKRKILYGKNRWVRAADRWPSCPSRHTWRRPTN